MDALDLLAGAADATVVPGEAGGAEANASAPDDAHARCLDSTHAAGCTECVAAPPFGEEGLYELSGDPGRKNGEKLLKSQLSRTPEWRSKPARLATAAQCEPLGRTMLGRVLRGANTSASLRKQDMLFLARAWGYKSQLWRLRKSRRRPSPTSSDCEYPRAASAAPTLEAFPTRLVAPAPASAPPLAPQPLPAPAALPVPQLPQLSQNPFMPHAFALALPGMPLLPFMFLAPPPQQLKTLLASSQGQGLHALLFQQQELFAMQRQALFGGAMGAPPMAPADVIAAMGHAAPAV